MACQNTKDVIQKFQSNVVDAVVTDINMPGFSGIEFPGKIYLSKPDVLRIFMTEDPIAKDR
ncbi:MAG: response regulator [Dissulfurispiraceae bacterium]